MRAVGYFRESIGIARSLAEQNKAFVEYCLREGLEAGETFADEAASNGTAPGFRQLVAFLREAAGATVVVVVQGVDALGVDLKEAARRYFQIEGLGAQVATISGAADGQGELLNAWSAREPAANLGDRVRAAMRKKAVKGEVLGRPPFGYKVGGRRRLELIPEEAVVVRYIFRLYLNENMGIRLIARRLNQEGMRTRRGGNWSMVSIRDILRNRAYLGTYSRFGVRVAGSHTSLVSADEFQTVQDRLNARRTSYSPRVTSQFLLSGIAYCGYCGNKLIGVSRKQTWKRRSGEKVSNSYRYYQCESRTNQSVCGYHTRRAADLETDVRQALADAHRDAQPEVRPHDDGADAAERERDVERLRARLRAIDKKFDGHVAAAAKGMLSKERMRALGMAAAKKRLAIEDALEDAERRNATASSTPSEAVHSVALAARMADGWEAMAFAERYRGLRDALSRITVTDESMSLSFRP